MCGNLRWYSYATYCWLFNSKGLMHLVQNICNKKISKWYTERIKITKEWATKNIINPNGYRHIHRNHRTD